MKSILQHSSTWLVKKFLSGIRQSTLYVQTIWSAAASTAATRYVSSRGLGAEFFSFFLSLPPPPFADFKSSWAGRNVSWWLMHLLVEMHCRLFSPSQPGQCRSGCFLLRSAVIPSPFSISHWGNSLNQSGRNLHCRQTAELPLGPLSSCHACLP